MLGDDGGGARPRVRRARGPRPPVEDPTLGVKVEVDRAGRPANRLVTIGDSITQGFMNAAVFRTDLSWPSMVAFELGLRLGAGFRYPVYEHPTGPGGLPFDLERALRSLEAVVGDRLDWHEAVRALRWARSYMDAIEDYWERGEGRNVPPTAAPYHNLAVYGADVLDVLLLDADHIAKRLERRPRDDPFAQVVEGHNDRAWRVVLESCRGLNGKAGTVLDAARAMGDEGLEGGGSGPGIETLVVMLGANNALGTVVHLDARWTPADYLDLSPRRRLDSKGAYNVWRPAHFADEWGLLVKALKSINARHVIVGTVPQVTIAPIARGWRGKVYRGSRFFPYYIRPWINDADFDVDRDQHLTESEARQIDSAIDAYNATIIASVRAARREGHDWYLFDLGGLLDSLASRRYVEDPAARPRWWQPYNLPPELTALTPIPDTRFFLSGPGGRTDGGLFSLDGVHPTTIGYGIVARELVRIMNDHARVPFFTQDGAVRAPASVDVDFARVLASDTLIARPPRAFSSTVALLGWLDETVDLINGVFPFP
jgi:hypothetical protein